MAQAKESFSMQLNAIAKLRDGQADKLCDYYLEAGLAAYDPRKGIITVKNAVYLNADTIKQIAHKILR